jgi:hypothetical protein
MNETAKYSQEIEIPGKLELIKLISFPSFSAMPI